MRPLFTVLWFLLLVTCDALAQEAVNHRHVSRFEGMFNQIGAQQYRIVPSWNRPVVVCFGLDALKNTLSNVSNLNQLRRWSEAERFFRQQEHRGCSLVNFLSEDKEIWQPELVGRYLNPHRFAFKILAFKYANNSSRWLYTFIAAREVVDRSGYKNHNRER